MIEEIIKEAFCKEHGLNPEQVTVKITPEGIELIGKPLYPAECIEIAIATGEEDTE